MISPVQGFAAAAPKRGKEERRISFSKPVGLPDVQSVRVCDPSLLCLLLEEVKEILHSHGWFIVSDTENGFEQVIQELLECALQDKDTVDLWGEQQHPSPGEQQRGCDCCSTGETLRCQLDKSEERGHAKAGREQFVCRERYNELVFGVDFFWHRDFLSYCWDLTSVLVLYSIKKTRDCWPSL